MKGGKRPHGYTIIEVMLFMAISSFMFVIAVVAVSGKQASVEFKQGMQDINTQILSTVNDVANGQFPSKGDFTCLANADGGQPYIPPVGSVAQGANGGDTGCIFAGKVLQFRIGTDDTAYNTYTVVGRQLDASSKNAVTSFQEANPAAFDHLTVNHKLENGLIVHKVVECTSACDGIAAVTSPIGSFGFFGSFANADATLVDTLQSGSQSIITAVIPNSNFGDSHGAAINAINNNTLTLGAVPGDSHLIKNGRAIIICFRNGSRNGSVKIGGGNGQQFTTSVSLGGGVQTVCTT